MKIKTRGLYSRLIGTIYILLIAGGCCTNSIAAPPEIFDDKVSIPLSLDEAVSLGIRNNRGIQTAYLQRIGQKFDLYVSEGKFYPKLALASSYINNAAAGINTKTTGLAALR